MRKHELWLLAATKTSYNEQIKKEYAPMALSQQDADPTTLFPFKTTKIACRGFSHQSKPMFTYHLDFQQLLFKITKFKNVPPIFKLDEKKKT